MTQGFFEEEGARECNVYQIGNGPSLTSLALVSSGGRNGMPKLSHQLPPTDISSFHK